MKIGKLTALWLCWELWGWLTDNPTEGKWMWPKWTWNKGGYNASCDCFACEYKCQHDRSSCDEDCIIPCFRYEDNGCENLKSPYDKWENAKTSKTRKKYARIIADSAYKEYVRIGGKKRK